MMIDRIKIFFKKTWHKLVHLHDSPHRIAFGLALGVLFGVLPSLGPLAALGLAFLFRVNRAAAVIGSLLTNTWLSLLTLVFAVKFGAWATGSDWHGLYKDCHEFITQFHWKKLWDGLALSILKPLFIGYFIVGLIVAALTYVVTFWILTYHQKHKKSR